MNNRELADKIRDHYRKPLFLLLALMILCSHDLYLKMESYFLEPNQKGTLSLYNGTFEKSENIITRDRMLDASIVAHGKRLAINPVQWKDQDSTVTYLTFDTGAPGTYVAGISTKPRNIELTAEKFNDYLKHDGVLDMLEMRTKNGTLDQDAVESYEKHVKAIYQVGDVRTNEWRNVLGYPIEFIPQANPYDKYSGEKLDVQLLLLGKPLTNQLVYADYVNSKHTHAHGDHAHNHGDEEHAHDHKHEEGNHSHDDHSEAEDGHTHTSGQQLRTNELGMVTVDLPDDGVYYLRTIHMVPVTNSDVLTHMSTWATLTFEVTHKHDESTHPHNDHEQEGGIPTWVFVLGSMLIIGLLFLFFRKKD